MIAVPAARRIQTMLAVWNPIELVQRAMYQPDMYCVMVLTALLLWRIASRGSKQ